MYVVFLRQKTKDTSIYLSAGRPIVVTDGSASLWPDEVDLTAVAQPLTCKTPHAPPQASGRTRGVADVEARFAGRLGTRDARSLIRICVRWLASELHGIQYPCWNQCRTSGRPQYSPSTIEIQPTATAIPRVTARCVPTRAMGQPIRPDSAAMPSVEPMPNSAR